ncbi:MAG: hypothetical protein HYR90_00080 [Candidatus Andersenbacteria bacterium]|nr:hypothetical protein [Candidatus Andersenbacteria bacterium]
MNDITLATGGTLSGSSQLLKVAGSWTNTGGAFTEGTSTVMFTSASDETITSNGDNFNNVIINDGLVGYWKFDEGEEDTCSGGEDICDSSGYGYHGTISNAAEDFWVGGATTTNFTNAHSLDFDGSDDYVSMGDVLDMGSDDWTASVWFKTTDTDFSLISKSQFAAGDGRWYLVYSAGALQAGWDGPTVAGVASWTTASVRDDAWHLATATWDRDGNLTLYVDGFIQGTLSIAADSTYGAVTSNILTFGRYNDVAGTGVHATDLKFDGLMDDVRIYNRVLTGQEVNTLAVGNQPATENTAASEFTLEDTLDVNGNLVLNSGELDTKSGENNNITLAGEWHNNGGKFTPRTNTVTLDGTTELQELQSGGQNFYNLTVSGTGGWTLHDRLEVDNTAAQSAGTLGTSVNSYNIHAGDWDQTAGTFNVNSSTLTLKSSSSQTINTDDSLYDLQVEDPTEASLLGYWKFDEGQGTSAGDSSGNGNTGTLTNTPRWIESINSTTTYDNPYSLDFDASDDYVTMGDVATLDVNDTADLVISGWFNRDTFTTDDTLVAKRNGQAAGDTGYIVYIDDSEDDIRFEISDDTDEYQLDSATTFTATGWNHFVIVWDQDSAANSEIYINGVDDNATDTGTIANIGTAVNAVDFRFGGESDGGELFEGKLDDVRVYSAVLSAASITALAAGKYADGDNSTATFTLNKTLDVTHSAFLQSGILDASASNCSSATCAISVAQNWNNYGGTSSFTARTGTVTLDGVNQTINGSTTFYNLSKTESVNNAADETVTMQASETTTVSHTLTLDGRDPSDEIALISSSSGTKHTINVSGGGQTVDHVDVKDSQASSNDITCQACTNSGGNDNAEASPHWVFQAGGSITVAGTVYSDEGSTPLTGGKTVSVAINGGVEASGETNTTTGVYSITSPPTTAGDVMTIYLENETEDAVTVTVNDGTNMSGVDLYQNKLITRHDNAGSLTNANLSTAQFGTGGSTVFSDLFTTASDTALLSHAPNTGTSWTKLLSFGNTTVNNLTVKAADYLQRGGGSGAVNTGSLYTANATYPSANYEVSVQQVQAQPDDDYSSIAARIQDANNFYVFWWSEGGGALGKVVSGASSSLGSTAVSIADGSIVKLRVEGTSIQVYDDSTLLIDATDSSITAAGKAGVGMGALKSNLLPSADLTLQRVDSFSVKTIGEDDITAIYSVTNGELTMVSGKELLVWGGDTFAPGGKINVDDIDINGTLTLSSNTAKVSGSWDATGGSFTSSGNVVFTSPSDETIISDGDAFNNVYINDGLIGYWKMDAGTGTTVVDSSGYGFNGTLTNSAGGWTSSAPSVNFTDPYALDFDGTDDYVDIADTDTLDVGPTADFTISGWFNRDTFTTMDTILAKKENTATTPGYLLYIHDTLDVLGFKVADGLTAYSVTSTSTFTSTGWNHFVVVWDQDSSANTKMYINGVAEGTPSGTIGNVGDLSNSLSLRFGTESDDGNPFDGKLDDIRIYNRVLTAQEVNSLAVGNQPATENTAASEFTLEDTLDVNGNLVLNSGELDTKSGEDNSITLAGEWHNNGGKFTPRSGTVTLDGSSSSQEIQSGGQNFNNLTVSGSGGWTMHDRLEVDGAFAQSAGTFSTSSSNYNIQSGDWDQTAGTFNPNSSTVTLKSSSNQTINTDDPFYDLQVEDPTPANLLGYWKFDEGQGTSAFDSSGNASTGTLTNTPLWTETVNSTTTYDNPYSLDFDGTDDYVTAGDIAAVDTVTALTVCAWVYHDTATTDDSIVSKTASATLATDGFMLFRDDVGSASARTDTYKWGVGDSADGDSVYIEGATNAGTASAWRNVCGTYTASSATGLRLYINGAEDANSPASTSSIAAINGGTAAVQVGMISTSSIPFDGKIDDVRIYSSALTSTQIAALAAGKYADGNTSVATFTLNTALDVNHDLYLQSGILDVSASNCSSASCAITDARNWNNYGGTSSLTARTGTVTLDGTDQSVNGSTTFYNLTKNESSNNATDETVTMQINQTTTVSSRFTLEGRDSDDRINIVSSSAGTKHTIDVTAGQQVTHWVDVKDSQSSTSNIACQQCVNSGGNDDADAAPHWLFGEGSGRNRLVRALATD